MTTSTTPSSVVLVGIGNPLLDISAEVPTSLLEKYELKAGNAILAEDKHLPLYDELIKDYKVSYIAGGATQNSIRVAQWLSAPKSTAYIGSVGDDENGSRLKKAAEADGVEIHYHIDSAHPTGTCAVLVTDKERSLIANLAAANHYSPDHLHRPEVKDLLEQARFYYSAGFFLTVSPPSLMHIAQHAAQHNKIMCGNISAPFIAMFFTTPLLAALPYYDYIFGNESEAEAIAPKLNLNEDKSIESVAKALANYEKVNSARERTVIITQGSKQTVVATVSGGVRTFDVPYLDQSLIVDLNGAGDAFVGGFLSQLIQSQSIETCIAAAHYAARQIIQVSGTELKGKPDFHP